MRNIRSLILTAVVTTGITSVLSTAIEFAGIAEAQQRYRVDPKVRKSKSREALTKAMMLNAQVEIMLNQGSDQIDRMRKMLDESYGHQVTAIAQMEGVYRESSFKDPTLQKIIDEMYTSGKPPTMEANGQIRSGDFGNALGSLAAAKRTHQKFRTFLY